ncbi:4-hydroxy-tetrahydrodipicolinate synthase [Pseudoclavibacter sp. JAI123]|uniref:dihydrodipicolinate synthase family protein n=1 Tax=Pseudoclavibacter sp. JAI123 TaxID=2723065 RepID=UPI0015CDC606|nr:dihydrodipicolinate synthase family protein [Pseudoclavibacter sp. JAI123]NYF12394.1 4-hydroxy-tetrahydrodipicolinate synthase [Pseudoclavibacter sp. JAI123]
MHEQAARLSDVVAIPVTPFADGAIDFQTLRSVLDRMLDAGVRVLTPNGNTGEFYALRPDERLDIVRAVSTHASGRALIVAGVGFDTDTAIADGRAAAKVGAEMVMIHQPVHPYISRTGWIDYHATIADALPELGVVLYVRNPWVDGSMIAELAARSPNVVGVKYAIADPVMFARVRSAAPQLAWIAGLAEPYALSYFAHGATGFTSGLVCVNPGLSLELLDALRDGDTATARRLTESIREFEELRALDSNANNVSVIKEALFQLGVGSRAVRPPSAEVDAATAAHVSRILTAWSANHELHSHADLAASA